MAEQEQEFANVEIDLDFTDVPAWDGTQRPLPPVGEYQLTVLKITQETIGQNTPALKVEFEIANNEDESLNGTKVWNNYPLTTAAQGRLKQFMVAGGGGLSKFNSAEYIGVTIRATIIHSEGAAKIKSDGTPQPARTFANVMNERPLEEPKAQAKTEVEKPPVTRANAATAKPVDKLADKAKTGGARRA